jgi:hypothetical protein
MARDPRARNDEKPRRRADGVTIAPAPGSRKALGALLGAATLAGLAILVLVWGTRPEPDPPRDAPVLAHADSGPEPAPEAPARPPRRAHPVPTRVPGAAPAPEPDVAPSADAPGEAETPEEGEAPFIVPSGIGLFPPPGTDPVKVGIIVPENFELPEGYLRHYQVTDDGQDLPPILMFHPDYDWVDETGNHVDVSQDRVVPPELAPEGMPIEYLEPPAEPSEP